MVRGWRLPRRENTQCEEYRQAASRKYLSVERTGFLRSGTVFMTKSGLHAEPSKNSQPPHDGPLAICRATPDLHNASWNKLRRKIPTPAICPYFEKQEYLRIASIAWKLSKLTARSQRVAITDVRKAKRE